MRLEQEHVLENKKYVMRQPPFPYVFIAGSGAWSRAMRRDRGVQELRLHLRVDGGLERVREQTESVDDVGDLLVVEPLRAELRLEHVHCRRPDVEAGESKQKVPHTLGVLLENVLHNVLL